MKHVEFFDRDHFEYNYHRKKAAPELENYIDFFWETRFDALWPSEPTFTDILFPNVGYTYMINLGTPFSIQLDRDKPYPVKNDAFIPRYRNISTHHSEGNRIFGIKFTISPVVLEKNVDFSEYIHSPASLAYLIAQDTLKAVKHASGFSERVQIVSGYYQQLIRMYEHSSKPVQVVKQSIDAIKRENKWDITVAQIAESAGVDIRTLQRIFESTTSISTKQALQMIRVRRAISELIASPDTFDCKAFGYYDNSHFYKQLHAFFGNHPSFDKTNYLSLLHESPVKIHY